jgi:hypothetical protein
MYTPSVRTVCGFACMDTLSICTGGMLVHAGCGYMH